MLSTEKKLVKIKPRLLIILNRFVIGGPAVDTIPLAWHLKKDFEIIILYGEKETDEVEPEFLLKKYPGLQLKKIKSLRRTFNPFLDINAFLHVLVILSKFKPHIVHTHGAKSGFTGRLAAWISRTPVIIHTYHGHFFHSYFSKKVSALVALAERIIGKITTRSIALSEVQKNELVSEFKILPASKVAVIELGFDFNENIDFDAKRVAFRSKYNLQSTDIAIAIVGRIVPVKNHSFFVRAISEMLTFNKENPPAFFIIGDGELRKQIEKELNDANIPFSDNAINGETRVVFTSWLTDIYEVMNGLDIVALTSLNEGTPLSIIEAQFFKKPVVCTNVGGVADCMQDTITGFLSEKNDIITFTEKLQFLIDNKDLRVEMGKAGNQFVSEKFSKQKEIELTKNLYFSLLNEKGFGFSLNVNNN